MSGSVLGVVLVVKGSGWRLGDYYPCIIVSGCHLTPDPNVPKRVYSRHVCATPFPRYKPKNILPILVLNINNMCTPHWFKTHFIRHYIFPTFASYQGRYYHHSICYVPYYAHVWPYLTHCVETDNLSLPFKRVSRYIYPEPRVLYVCVYIVCVFFPFFWMSVKCLAYGVIKIKSSEIASCCNDSLFMYR
jgi:hypothetical protein